MRRPCLALVVVCTLGSAAFGEPRKQVPATRFWNLTPFILSEFNLAPAGTTNWGPNQCTNDRDGTVSPNERLRITDTAPGTYDARLKDATGRVCFARNLKVETNEIFSIEERDLVNCQP
jgi:hypothetical protein